MNQDIIARTAERARGEIEPEGIPRSAGAGRRRRGGCASPCSPALEASVGQGPIVAPDDKNLVTGEAKYRRRRHEDDPATSRARSGEEEAGRHRHQREPRPQRAHRGCRPPLRGGRVPRLCARSAVAIRRHAADPAEVGKLFGSLNAAETVARLAAAVKFLATHAESTGKVGVVGFCWGGGMVNRLSRAGCDDAECGRVGLRPQLPAAEVPKICADPECCTTPRSSTRINAGITGLRGGAQGAQEAIRALHVRRGRPRVHNNTRAPATTRRRRIFAWKRTLEFFNRLPK